MSRDDLRRFGRDGYVVLPDVIDPPSLAAALARIDELLLERPPAPGLVGHHFYFEPASAEPALMQLLGAVMPLAAEFVAPWELEMPGQVQVALTFPPHPHTPGRGHIDGLTPPEPSGRPGTFTMLAGIVLSDQSRDDTGNLWVWPGTHRELAELLSQRGPGTLIASGGYPPVAHDNPTQVHANPGDVIFANYLLSHNVGGNTSPIVRKTVYFRLKTQGHDSRWRQHVTDIGHEFPMTQAR